MIGRALNSNNDLIIEKGSFKLVKDAAEILQHVRTRLLFYVGEWFLDINAGTPHFQNIFTKPANLANIESILKSRILNTDEVLTLLEFSMAYEGESVRRLTINFSAETPYGIIENEKVTINA